MRRCKTCKFFISGLYPLNAQLGHCTNLVIKQNEQGYVLSQFNFHGSEPPPITRIMNDFGCEWHQHIEQKGKL